MRALSLPVLALALIAANEEVEVETLRPDPPMMQGELLERFKDIIEGNTVQDFDGKQIALSEILRSDCRDRLDYAKSEKDGVTVSGRPLFERRPGSPENPPLAIYAVDRRENGCGVMVVMGDPEDVRPIPRLDSDDYRLMPAESDPEN